jgi:hypothetical protein
LKGASLKVKLEKYTANIEFQSLKRPTGTKTSLTESQNGISELRVASKISGEVKIHYRILRAACMQGTMFGIQGLPLSFHCQ